MVTTRRLAQLGSGVLVFHVLNSVLQEAVFHLPGFHHSALLTLLQSCCIAFIAFFEFRRTGQRRRTPLSTYFLLSIFSTGSFILTNEASRLLNYPTQVLFKSSKLLVIMIVRAIVLHLLGVEGKLSGSPLAEGSPLSPATRPAFFRRQLLMEISSGLTIVFGIVTFTYATSAAKMRSVGETTSGKDVFGGVLSIVVAMILDALLYVGQEKYCFKGNESSESEVIFYLYGLNTVYSLFATMVGSVFRGDTGGDGSHSLFSSFGYLFDQPTFGMFVVGFSVCNFLGTNILLRVVAEFDSNAAVVVTSIRKVLTILASFIVYPKPVGLLHVVGGICVFAGVYLFEDTRVKAKEEKEKELRQAKERGEGGAVV